VRLSRLKIDGFKCLRDVDWRPAAGLNLVLGPNESGKTTLAEFTEAMIFGLPGGASGEECRPWSGSGFGGRVEFDCGRVLVVIERDFGSGSFRYEEIDTASGTSGEPLSGQLRRGSSGGLFGRYRELFRRHLGFFDDKLFRRSTFVPQGELLLSARDLGEAAASLRSLAAGGGSTYDRALQALQNRYYALTGEGDRRRKPGVLDRLREEKSELSVRIREGREHAERVAQIRSQLREKDADLQRLREESKLASQIASLHAKRLELGGRREALATADRSDRERLEAADDAAKSDAELERRLAAYEDLSAAGDSFPDLVNRARVAHEKVERLEADSQAMAADSASPYPFFRNLCAAAAAFLVGGAALAAGIITGVLAATVAGAAVCFAGLVGSLMVYHFKRRSEAQAGGQRSARERLEGRLEGARREIKAATAALIHESGGRVDFRAGAMEELLKRYWARKELLARRQALASAVIEDQERQELAGRISDTVTKLAVIDERIEQTDAEIATLSAARGADCGKLAARAGELEGLVRAREEEKHRLDLELAALGSAETASAAAEDRLEEVGEAITRHEFRCRSLQLAASELAGSIQEFQDSHLERLAELAGEMLSRMTLERYCRVELETESMTPRVSGTVREGIRGDQLSHGTRSALYLALRLAMGKLISGGRELPLILDDPLVDLDDERRAGTIEHLGALAEQNQVILLSCDRRLSGSDAAIFELDG
jgi:hypothetical protein